MNYSLESVDLPFPPFFHIYEECDNVVIKSKYLYFKKVGYPSKTCTGNYCNWCIKDCSPVRFKCFKKDTDSLFTYINKHTDLGIYCDIGLCGKCIIQWIQKHLEEFDQMYLKTLSAFKQSDFGKKLPDELLDYILEMV